MIKWDDLTIRVTLPDGTKQQSHAHVTGFNHRKNWLVEAEEGPTLEYGFNCDTDELEKWINSYPAGSVVVTKRKKDVRTTGIANKLDEQTICETLQGVWSDSSVSGKRYALTRTYAGTCVEEKLKEQLDICHVQFDTRCKAAAETIAKKIEEYKKFASEEN